jgi:sarcosine oxidase subunit alpha
MPERISLEINGATIEVPRGTSVAAALLIAGQPSRVSVSGYQRAALCGMGVCFECRAIVNGMQHQRTCQLLCEFGMTVETER